MAEGFSFAKPFTLTCPECGGALFPPEGGGLLVYACHIGHELSWPALMEAQLTRIEASLGTLMVLMKERAELCRQLADNGEVTPHDAEPLIAEALARAQIVKELLEKAWIEIPTQEPS